MLVDGEPVHFRSGKAKELMALCVYRDGRPVSIHGDRENLWGENADGTGYRRTIKELADTCGTMARRRCSCAAGGACGCGWTWRTRIFRHS